MQGARLDDLVGYYAKGLNVEKSVLIAHLSHKEVWNLSGGDQDPPSISTLYKGPRTSAQHSDDTLRIVNGIKNYAEKHDHLQTFEKLREGQALPLQFKEGVSDSLRRSRLKKIGDVRFTGFVYVIKSPSLVEDSGKSSVTYGYGYFVLRREIKMVDKAPLATVLGGKAWFLTEAPELFAHEDMRGDWESKYVGISLHDVLIIYDFRFDPHLNAENYIGMIAAKVNENESNRFGTATRAVATGEFYYLSDPHGKRLNATQNKRRSGKFYIERVQDLKDPREGDKVLRAALSDNRKEIYSIFN